MTSDHIKAFNNLFFHIYRGDVEAIKVSFKVLHFVHAWDDQFDEGKQLSDEVLLSTLVDIGASPLWTADMGAHFKLVYLKWTVSNKFESNKIELEKSWMLRAAVYDIFVMLADKLYGTAYAKTIAPLVYQTYGETLQDFLQEINNA